MEKTASGDLSKRKRTSQHLANLDFHKAMQTAHCIEHQIDAATLYSFACHLDGEYRMLEEFFEQVLFRIHNHGFL